MTVNNQNSGFSVFLQFVAAAQISKVNCDEKDRDKSRQPVN